MQFLKTLFWVVLVLILVIFSIRNWADVTINLWGGLQADVKLPVLVIGSVLLGFLPMLIVHRARLWSLKRRLEPVERPVPAAPAEPEAPLAESAASPDDDRLATDSKVWPQA